MTPSRLNLLDELLGEFRAEHAPRTSLYQIDVLRAAVRRVASAETVAARVGAKGQAG